jgi:hypothetical protein
MPETLSKMDSIGIFSDALWRAFFLLLRSQLFLIFELSGSGTTARFGKASNF